MSTSKALGFISPEFIERIRSLDLENEVTTMVVSGTEAEVCEDISKRQQMGIKKYGQTVADNPLNETQWLQHAYEEALDLAIYLKRLLQEKERLAQEEETRILNAAT